MNDRRRNLLWPLLTAIAAQEVHQNILRPVLPTIGVHPRENKRPPKTAERIDEQRAARKMRQKRKKRRGY